MSIITVGIDLAKNVFAVHGVDENGKAVLVKPKVSREHLSVLIAQLPPCVVGMEACSGAHQWARQFRQGRAIRDRPPGHSGQTTVSQTNHWPLFMNPSGVTSAWRRILAGVPVLTSLCIGMTPSFRANVPRLAEPREAETLQGHTAAAPEICELGYGRER